MSKPRRSIRQLTALSATEPIETSFAEVVGLIEQARQRAYQAINTELVGLYWQIGQYVSRKLAAAEWGEGVVDRLAQHLARTMPGLRGFSVQNLWRMRQFNETYRDDPKLSALVRVLPWTHNLVILGQSKRPEEREFYLRMAARLSRSKSLLRYVRLPQVIALVPFSKSTLWRQVKSGAFPKPVKLSARITAWRVEDVRRWIGTHGPAIDSA